MTRTRHTTEQFIGLLGEDEVKLSQGVTVGGFKLQCATLYGLSAHHQSGQSSNETGRCYFSQIAQRKLRRVCASSPVSW